MKKNILILIIFGLGIFLNIGCASTSRHIDSYQKQNITTGKYTLGNLDEQKAKEYLIGILKNSKTEDKIRQAAAIALSPHIQDYPQIRKPLEDILKGQNTRLKKDIILGLGQAKGKVAFDMIKPFANDNEPILKQAAILALAYSDIPEAIDIIKPLANDPIPEVRQITALSLGIRQDIKAIEPLKKLTTDQIPQIRATALESLAYIPVETGSRLRQGFGGQAKQLRVAEIKPFLDDPSPVVRVTAAEILIPEVEDFPELETKFIKLAGFDDDIMVKSVATLGLGNIDKPEVLDIVKTNLGSSDWRLRQAATLASGKIELPEATKLLTYSLVDKHPFVRLSAATAIKYKVEYQPTLIKDIESFVDITKWKFKPDMFSQFNHFSPEDSIQVEKFWASEQWKKIDYYQNVINPIANFDAVKAAGKLRRIGTKMISSELPFAPIKKAAKFGIGKIVQEYFPKTFLALKIGQRACDIADIASRFYKANDLVDSIDVYNDFVSHGSDFVNVKGVGLLAGMNCLLTADAIENFDKVDVLGVSSDYKIYDQSTDMNINTDPDFSKYYDRYVVQDYGIKEIKVDIPIIQTYEPIKIDDSWRK